MNYPLLITVCGLALGLIGMERWASWRLSVAQRPKKQPEPESEPASLAAPTAEFFDVEGDQVLG